MAFKRKDNSFIHTQRISYILFGKTDRHQCKYIQCVSGKWNSQNSDVKLTVCGSVPNGSFRQSLNGTGTVQC